MKRSAEIETRLRQAFAVSELEVRNDSARHSGHAGDDGSGESHFHVRLRAPELKGQNRVAQHRMVHKALGELTAEIHALSLDVAG